MYCITKEGGVTVINALEMEEAVDLAFKRVIVLADQA